MTSPVAGRSFKLLRGDSDDQADRTVQERLVRFDRYRLFKENRIISGRTGQFEDREQHDVNIFIIIGVGFYQFKISFIKDLVGFFI
ncbi:MAG: hypothetical protein ACLR2O_06320 [Coprococcus sp.]